MSTVTLPFDEAASLRATARGEGIRLSSEDTEAFASAAVMAAPETK